MTDAAREPRTISGRAWSSGLRPHLRRAVSATIVAIEDEAVKPYVEVMRDAQELAVDLRASKNPIQEPLAARAAALEERIGRLLDG